MPYKGTFQNHLKSKARLLANILYEHTNTTCIT
jgi:hypothetical protein